MRLLSNQLPIVAAPMAGGPMGTALARAAAQAGAFPFLAGGNKTRESLAAELAELRAEGIDVGVNLFVLEDPPVDVQAFAEYARRLRPEAEAHEVLLDPTPVHDDDHLPAKLELLLSHPVPLVSFTFGMPTTVQIRSLQEVGTRVLMSVTTPEEAAAAEARGADGLVVQGFGAGGHSAIHDPRRFPEEMPTEELVGRILAAVDLPVIAGGGVDGPQAVRRILDAGVEAVSIGTLLLRTEEAGTSLTHRAALADPTFTETVLTMAFTGRPARSLRNGLIDRHHDAAPVGYPEVHHLTKALRQAAGAAGDADRLHLWAGTGWRSARSGPVAETLRWLAEGAA